MSAYPGDGLKRPAPRPTHDPTGHMDAGSHNYYTRGCRCDGCKAAHAEYRRLKYEAERRETLELREHLARLKAEADQ